MTIERQPRLEGQLLNDVCKVLADPVRRQLLYELADDGRVSLREPPEYASDGGSDTSPTRLHHQHLPMLAAAGLVDWNERTGDVHPTDTLERVRSVLETVRTVDPAAGR